MIGRQDRWQEDLFVGGPLSSLVPEDHILKQVDKFLDLSWLRGRIKVCGANGGCLSRILPSLTREKCILGPKSNIGCSEAVE